MDQLGISTLMQRETALEARRRAPLPERAIVTRPARRRIRLRGRRREELAPAAA